MTTRAPHATAADELRIDFLYLDVERCTRCRGTDRNLESALEAARAALTASGTQVEVNRIHVDSVELARQWRFESSPTIRVNGRDIALVLRESSCGSEACADGCGESIACRVWVHDGQEYTEPPVPMILDAILREVYRGAVVSREVAAEPYELPPNLARFFAGGGAAEPAGAKALTAAAAPAQAACCSPGEQSTCCETEDKAGCCGAAPAGACGCR